jgi:uncharacterized protein (TIGR02594 family)
MLGRRTALKSVIGGSLIMFGWPAIAEDGSDQLLVPQDSPMISDLTKLHPFGSHPASVAEIAKANNIIANTPTGPRPIDIAQSFVDRFYKAYPHAISEWPKAESWNPLIAKFFDATSTRTEQDTVAWCAAFVNWCLERAGKPATRSSGSQSFVTTKLFKVTQIPIEGDIAVFTCCAKGTTSSLGVGHVTFFKGAAAGNKFVGLGGNQAGKTLSIISEQTFPFNFPSSRVVGGRRVPVDYRISKFLHVA